MEAIKVVEAGHIRKDRGSFDREPTDPSRDVEIVAAGRDSWVGRVELASEAGRGTDVVVTAPWPAKTEGATESAAIPAAASEMALPKRLPAA